MDEKSATNMATADLPHTLTANPPSDQPESIHRGPMLFKIIVIGDSNCGKTSLIYRYCEGHFPNHTTVTIGVNFKEKSVKIGNDTLKLQFWDTAGMERFRRSMIPQYYRNVHAVVYVYDVTRQSSFYNLSKWLKEFHQYVPLNLNVPRIVVGNKVDLDHLRMVSTDEAQRFAEKHTMPYFETSAKDDDMANNTEAIFMTLAHKLKVGSPMMGELYYSHSGRDSLSTRPALDRSISLKTKSKPSCC